MQVTVTGGTGHPAASLTYDANDIAFMNAQALAATITSTYTTALYYDPANPLQTPSSGYLIIQTDVANNVIDARGFGAIVDENNGVSSTINGGAAAGQIVLAGDGGLDYSAHIGGATVVAGGGDNRINLARDTSDVAVYTSIGDDTIFGGDGATTISAGAGENRIVLGAGTSVVESTGTDVIKLGSGSDTINVLQGGSVFIRGATSVSGSGFSLTFNGGALASTIRGGAGSYSIAGGAGGGWFKGASGGDNYIAAGTGAATIVGGGEGDTLLGGASTDLIRAGLGNETLGGGAGADTFNLVVHETVGGSTSTDTIMNYSTDEFFHVGDATATNYALNTYQVSNGSGSFLLEDGTKVVLQGYTGTLTNSNFH